MATLQVTVSDQWLEAFQSKYLPEQRTDVLTSALIELVQDDPYTPEALAEDERRFQDVLLNGGVPHEKVKVWLEAQARGDFTPWRE